MPTATLPLTHYWPWDGDEQRAICGTFMRGDARRHSLDPTCPACAARLAEADAAIDATVEATTLPLDAEEAAALTPRSPLADDLFDLALSLTRVYALGVRR